MQLKGISLMISVLALLPLALPLPIAEADIGEIYSRDEAQS